MSRIQGKVLEIITKDSEGNSLVTKSGSKPGTPFARVILQLKYRDDMGDIVIGKRALAVFNPEDVELCQESLKHGYKVDLEDRSSAASSEFVAEAA